MSSLALVFVGAVLLANGLVFLGRMSPRAAIPVNLLVGALIVTTALLGAVPAALDERAMLFGALGFSVFGFTYLIVALNSLLDADGSGVGWFCGWAAIVSCVLAMVSFGDGDPRLAWLWVSWVVLFTAFFLAATVDDARFGRAAGVVAVIQSVTTGTIPGLLMVGGTWEDLSVTVIAAVQILGVVGYLATLARPARVVQHA
ncbi:amidase substrates transport protein [Gordonia sp. PDNC005]|uniref:AmiS/UreI family transporter n=1 Tax=unclassified Gordonia (in: high G+C Gram-positive bacteria) TaxID=2657482 RepID=UPI00196459FB|nr:AmiS/UreI family transporter [Gordonia sp. PDNC005]QRY63033.1 amidase substrates transport protein [Gordonia sp. PDNC005]